MAGVVSLLGPPSSSKERLGREHGGNSKGEGKKEGLDSAATTTATATYLATEWTLRDAAQVRS